MTLKLTDEEAAVLRRLLFRLTFPAGDREYVCIRSIIEKLGGGT